MKAYKRKRHLINDSRDSNRCNDLKKHLNSSERQRGNSEAVSGIKEYEDMFSPELISYLRWGLESEHSSKCYEKEVTGVEFRFAKTLQRFGLPWANSYKCKCPKFDKMTDEEILKISGYL